MFFTYQDLTNKYKSYYYVKKLLRQKKLYKVKPGLYTDTKEDSLLPELFLKRSDTVLTLQSAIYYHGLTDYIPKVHYVSTPRNAYPIKLSDVKQIFTSHKYYTIGIAKGNYLGHEVRIYDLERTVIEWIRYETKLPFEEYHHVIRNIRAKSTELDYNKLYEYATHFRSFKKIVTTIQNTIL